MREIIEKIGKAIYVANMLCAILMGCCLDSESLVPIYVLAINLVILSIPLAVEGLKNIITRWLGEDIFTV